MRLAPDPIALTHEDEALMAMNRLVNSALRLLADADDSTDTRLAYWLLRRFFHDVRQQLRNSCAICDSPATVCYLDTDTEAALCATCYSTAVALEAL